MRPRHGPGALSTSAAQGQAHLYPGGARGPGWGSPSASRDTLPIRGGRAGQGRAPPTLAADGSPVAGSLQLTESGGYWVAAVLLVTGVSAVGAFILYKCKRQGRLPLSRGRAGPWGRGLWGASAPTPSGAWPLTAQELPLPPLCRAPAPEKSPGSEQPRLLALGRWAVG